MRETDPVWAYGQEEMKDTEEEEVAGKSLWKRAEGARRNPPRTVELPARQQPRRQRLADIPPPSLLHQTVRPAGVLS